jgi:hypothetical protein
MLLIPSLDKDLVTLSLSMTFSNTFLSAALASVRVNIEEGGAGVDGRGLYLNPLLNISTGDNAEGDGTGAGAGMDVDVIEMLLLDVGDMDGRFDSVPKRLVYSRLTLNFANSSAVTFNQSSSIGLPISFQ